MTDHATTTGIVEGVGVGPAKPRAVKLDRSDIMLQTISYIFVTLFALFCCYALSGYVYQAWEWSRGKPNPARPAPPTIDSGEH